MADEKAVLAEIRKGEGFPVGDFSRFPRSIDRAIHNLEARGVIRFVPAEYYGESDEPILLGGWVIV